MSGGGGDSADTSAVMSDNMASASLSGRKTGGGGGNSASGSRSVSLASVSSDGSVASGASSSEAGQGSVGPAGAMATHLQSGVGGGQQHQHHFMVEQEDIVALTQEVRSFKEALGRLRRLFGPNENGQRGRLIVDVRRNRRNVTSGPLFS